MRYFCVPLTHEVGQLTVRGADRAGLGANGDRTSLDEMARRNVTVTVLSDAEKQVFARATRSVYDKYAQTVGVDLVRRAEAAVAGARA